MAKVAERVALVADRVALVAEKAVVRRVVLRARVDVRLRPGTSRVEDVATTRQAGRSSRPPLLRAGFRVRLSR